MDIGLEVFLSGSMAATRKIDAGKTAQQFYTPDQRRCVLPESVQDVLALERSGISGTQLGRICRLAQTELRSP